MKKFDYLTDLILHALITALSILVILVGILLRIYSIDNTYVVILFNSACFVSLIILLILISRFIVDAIDSTKEIE